MVNWGKTKCSKTVRAGCIILDITVGLCRLGMKVICTDINAHENKYFTWKYMVIQLVKSSPVEATITIVTFEISCGDLPNSILNTSSDSNGWVTTRDFKSDNGN